MEQEEAVRVAVAKSEGDRIPERAAITVATKAVDRRLNRSLFTREAQVCPAQATQVLYSPIL